MSHRGPGSDADSEERTRRQAAAYALRGGRLAQAFASASGDASSDSGGLTGSESSFDRSGGEVAERAAEELRSVEAACVGAEEKGDDAELLVQDFGPDGPPLPGAFAGAGEPFTQDAAPNPGSQPRSLLAARPRCALDRGPFRDDKDRPPWAARRRRRAGKIRPPAAVALATSGTNPLPASQGRPEMAAPTAWTSTRKVAVVPVAASESESEVANPAGHD